jgi:hypothetical protein
MQPMPIQTQKVSFIHGFSACSWTSLMDFDFIAPQESFGMTVYILEQAPNPRTQ